MNSIFIIAHSPLAQALRQCALHVFPDSEPTIVALDVLDQGQLQILLQLPDRLGDGRLADVQQRRRPGEALGIDHDHKDAQQVQVQSHNSDL